MGLSGYGEPREVDALQVSADFFRVLAVTPLIGRTFTAAEDVPDGPPVVVLSYGLWRQQFRSDRSIVGRKVQLHDMPYTVIGVMPEELAAQSASLRDTMHVLEEMTGSNAGRRC